MSARRWRDLERMLGKSLPHVKWVFPDAENQKVSCNMGMVMPSWFDLPDIPIHPDCREDPAAFKGSSRIHAANCAALHPTPNPIHTVPHTQISKW
eukprot:3691595-Pyramimonas_sp.AAC.2